MQFNDAIKNPNPVLTTPTQIDSAVEEMANKFRNH